MTGWDSLSATDLRDLAWNLRAGRLDAEPSAMALRTYCGPEQAEWLSATFHDLQASTATLAAILDLLASEREKVTDSRHLVDLVWSGPEVAGMTNRDTGAVVRELFTSAKRSIMVVGYAIHRGREVFATLAEHMDGNAGLEVRMVVDIQRPWGDTTIDHDLVAQFAAEFRHKNWPGQRLPTVFYDPRSLEVDPEQRSSMHAKCVVVDEETALVTSANFTIAAQNRNIELGLLVRQEALAGMVWHHFEALMKSGALRQVVFG